MQATPTPVDRIISGLTYMTAGTAGVIWLIICAIRRDYPNKFTMFNIMQSIFVTLCYVIVNFAFWWIVDLLSFIPLINRLVRQLIFIFNHPMLFGYSIMQCIIYGIVLYLIVFSFMGVYAYLPWFSKIILSNFRD